jgi:hypothetical protein
VRPYASSACSRSQPVCANSRSAAATARPTAWSASCAKMLWYQAVALGVLIVTLKLRLGLREAVLSMDTRYNPAIAMSRQFTNL